MIEDPTILIILSVLIGLAALVLLTKSVTMVPRHQVFIVEQLSNNFATLTSGTDFSVPLLDIVRSKIDRRGYPVSTQPHWSGSVDS